MITERLRKNWGLVLVSVLLAGGLWVSIQWSALEPAPVIYLFYVAPALIFLLAWLLASRFPRKRDWFIESGVVLTILAICFVFVGNSFMASMMPMRDVNQYEAIVHEAIVHGYGHELTEHFPPHIPSNAREVKFYYEPGFLQGGSLLQLRCKLPADEIATLRDRYLPLAKRVYSGSAIPITSFYNEKQIPGDLPQDFQILILGGKPYKTNPVDWNHGYTYGLAISTQRQEVIYYADEW